jgi:phosphatidylserine/phosphatidylglycerophosphate/cardiolipin synthase-like enzyme
MIRNSDRMRSMNKFTSITLLLLISFTQTLFASVDVMFHPYDPTLSTIAKVFKESQKSAQMVLYNIDVTDKSPLIQYLKSSEFQQRLKKGYQIQMIFEGYSSSEENRNKMLALENLGFDVRFLGISQKVHHKFTLFDAGLESQRLITGSANWSLSSMNNYDENILFIENEPAIESQFSNEFSLLWNFAHEFGVSLFPDSFALTEMKPVNDLHAFFNSSNYEWSDGSPQKFDQNFIPQLTRTVVSAIDQAQFSIEVATTRIKLAPVYAALMRAAERGVEIKIVVSQAEYKSSKSREKSGVKDCGDNLYSQKCSTGVNFSPLLDSVKTGYDNMQIRLKFFSLDLSENISHQMHNKYMLIDGRWILSGSFNWSNSSEWQHIENIVVVDGAKYTNALNRFQKNFESIWNMNRQDRSQILQKNKGCSLIPTSLTYQEIDDLRKKAFHKNICRQR